MVRNGFYKTAHVVTPTRDNTPSSGNHMKTASVSPALLKEAASRGLTRVAGNVFSCPSTKKFWSIRDGKLLRVTVSDIEDNGESIPGASPEDPSEFIQFAHSDLKLY